jgi:serine/threonine protein kinase
MPRTPPKQTPKRHTWGTSRHLLPTLEIHGSRALTPVPVVAVSFVLQACEALAEAHILGIVHRDLKPANLFLAKQPGGLPIVKVLDFGISKFVNSVSEPQLTRTSALMGVVAYARRGVSVSDRNRSCPGSMSRHPRTHRRMDHASSAREPPFFRTSRSVLPSEVHASGSAPKPSRATIG